MPPRTTQQSDRPRVSDRTMVGILPPCCLEALRLGKDERGLRWIRMFRTRCAQPRFGIKLVAVERGRVSKTPHPRMRREKYFFLTSPFIEPGKAKPVPQS